MSKIDLFVITGNLGSGKTTTGRIISELQSIDKVEPDTMRAEMGLTEYKPEDTPLVMRAIWQRIFNRISDGESIVLCTPYVSRFARNACYENIGILSDYVSREIQVVLVRCECPEDVSKQRIEARGGFHLPPFNPKAYDRVKASSEPIDEDEIDVAGENVSLLVYNTDANIITPVVIRTAHQDAVQNVMEALLD